MHFPSILFLLTTLTTTIAHPGPHKQTTRAELARRADLSARCSHHASHYNAQRLKRTLHKRQNSTVSLTTSPPYYPTIQNETCVLTPEVTAGPYWWRNSQTLRQDMTENQPGVPLLLDVGVLDMATCEPLENVLVDFWHCNATGKYSSFTQLPADEPIDTILAGLNVMDFEIGRSDIHTDEGTFLRGMWPTDGNGVVEMRSIFPGFYYGRAIHIHIQVHTDWVLRENGTLASGKTVSTGQVFFGEDLEREIMALEPYASVTKVERLTNQFDNTYNNENTGGYNALVSVVPMDGEDVTKGMIGFVTIGVDTEAVESFPV
ncbi:protocatechuate 3,4-dioxygenase beta subunit [Aspergillus sclerotioniger CBS 115572]|uniref:Protocatechuate 3,4-dioxygenase beta subunit n=1 Tax=Aspergillus sclerotioniger CBS 115572 TaxID=1450535 RepID=A0A317XAD1_9EURO|nr:protocatechuate 3,4-dioxygenase beta subunit [Aspergillus sclerotioniger CBS 115572]PWY95355.1 protocatechuate 3,4-dioxygenase beta subunit [Aspergillus sclerotioniger CBS 115572]